MPDNNRVACASQRVNDDSRVIGSTRIDVLTGQIRRHDTVTTLLERGRQLAPHPAAVPGTMYQREEHRDQSATTLSRIDGG
jgi:hypothetical protein